MISSMSYNYLQTHHDGTVDGINHDQSTDGINHENDISHVKVQMMKRGIDHDNIDCGPIVMVSVAAQSGDVDCCQL